MTSKEIIIALTIHLVIPLIGLIYFIRMAIQIQKRGITNPPTAELFIIFSTYGGLLLVMLTSLFWKWSGMASIGTFYLIICAPIVMGIIAFRHRKTKTISTYHYGAYLYGLLYFVVAPLAILIVYFASKN